MLMSWKDRSFGINLPNTEEQVARELGSEELRRIYEVNALERQKL